MSYDARLDALERRVAALEAVIRRNAGTLGSVGDEEAEARDAVDIEAAAFERGVRAFAEWYNIPDVADRYLAERKDA